MGKEIKYDQDARAKMLAGVDGLANAVRVTLGPKGPGARNNHHRTGGRRRGAQP